MLFHPSDLAAAIELLLTPPPEVDRVQAQDAAALHYGWHSGCTLLSGERDRNFVLEIDGQRSVALKFINHSESAQETDLQVRALAFLAEQEFALAVPRPIKTLNGEDGFILQTAQGPIRGRAYTFLEGEPAARGQGSAALRRSVGAAVGRLDLALRDFTHALAPRVFLWDPMHVGQLSPWVDQVQDVRVRAFVAEFLAKFTRYIAPDLLALPSQFIHADFSKSNLLVSPEDGDRVSAVLDFGDMVHAPRIADLAIAASYQMSDSNDPMAALDEVTQGFCSVSDLHQGELAHLLDMVVARLVARLVLTGWRASRFPENRSYILRSQPDALKLIGQIMPIWCDDFQRRYPKASCQGVRFECR